MDLRIVFLTRYASLSQFCPFKQFKSLRHFSGEIHWRPQNIVMFVFARFVSPRIFEFSALLAEGICPCINLASLREFITLRHFFSYARTYVCRRCYAPAEGKEIMENISSCGLNNKFKRASISWDQKREQILSAIDISSLTSKSEKICLLICRFV